MKFVKFVNTLFVLTPFLMSNLAQAKDSTRNYIQERIEAAVENGATVLKCLKGSVGNEGAAAVIVQNLSSNNLVSSITFNYMRGSVLVQLNGRISAEMATSLKNKDIAALKDKSYEEAKNFGSGNSQTIKFTVDGQARLSIVVTNQGNGNNPFSMDFVNCQFQISKK